MNKVHVSETLHGFRVTREVLMPEIKGSLIEMEHEATGLKLAWIAREEENKTFGIAFETLPWNDTGVFHILEHSVLCGSDRYPVKEPFIELVKNSLNTFLNAMTFPDKTFYPISSPNDKDFVNLMRVYLDAVLHPAIYSKPEIFGQEGWHYAFDENGEVSYKGVVFNEMKGAMASADELMDDTMNLALLPDTPYRFNSGGDPVAIPDLTYEQFIDTHKKFYSPSNAYIYLDGNLDIDYILGIIQDEFLADYERTERMDPPAMQAPVDGGSRTVTYEISETEEIEGHTRLAWGNVIGRFDEREKLVAVHVLHDVIAGNNNSPLPKVILEKNLAEDVIVSIMDSIAQPYAKMEVRNCREEDLDQIREIIQNELKRLVRDGLDHSQIEASMANAEFLMREKDYGSYPQGLFLGMSVLDSWLYGGHPEANLQVGSLFNDLKKKMDEGYFEQLLEEVFIENPHHCEVILTPSRTAGEERRQAEAERVQREQAAWTAEDRAAHQQFEAKLTEWQNLEDTEEDLAKLPHLTLEDIQDMPEDIPMQIREENGVQVITHDIATGGILYVSAYFDANHFAEEELSPLAFLSDALGKIDTEAHTAEELQTRSRLLLGGLGFSEDVYGKQNDPTVYNTKFNVNFSTLPKNLDEAVGHIIEILTSTKFDSESAVHDLLTQTRQRIMQSMIMAGNSVGVRRIAAMVTPAGVFNELTGGFGYYQWLKEQDENWNWDAFREMMIATLNKAIRTNMTVSVTGGSPEESNRVVTAFVQAFPAPEEQPESAVLKAWGIRREGIVIPADIAFACSGASLLPNGDAWNGEMSLIARMVTYSYLWNVIRVQGGAYGTGLSIAPSGNLACYSYRDPNGAASLEKFQTIGQYLREFLATDPDLTGFIIGAVSDANRLMTPRMKGAAADHMVFAGSTYEMRCTERRRMLDATPKKLLAHVDAIEQTLRSCGVSIVGGKNQIDACADLDEVLTL